MNVEYTARGRPRDPAADEAILNAAIQLLSEGGLEAVTMTAVIERSGVARATVYLRYPGREALISAALRKAIGRDPFPLSGDIETDFRRSGEQARSILSQPEFATILPALIRQMLTPDPESGHITFDALFPNRRLFASEYRALAGQQGFRTDGEVLPATDAVIGSLLLHLLATGEPPSKQVTEQTVDLVLRSLIRSGNS